VLRVKQLLILITCLTFFSVGATYALAFIIPNPVVTTLEYCWEGHPCNYSKVYCYQDGTFKDDGTITGSDSSATANVNEPNGYTEGNIGGVLKILFDPAPYRNILYNCEIIQKAVDLSEDTDEPLVPEKFRDILYYYAIADIYDFLKDNNNRDRWAAKAQSRRNQMIDKYRHAMGNPRIRPAYPRVKYA